MKPYILARQAHRSPILFEIKRLYVPPAILTFGDRAGEVITPVAPDQEQSVLILHNALNELHPKVRKHILAASNTGDLTEAAINAGVTQQQLMMLLPRLKAYLQRHLH